MNDADRMPYIQTASLLLLALVRSGNGVLIPGGLEELIGHIDPSAMAQDTEYEIGGRMKRVLRAFEFWADESPDLRRASQVLRELVKETVQMMTPRRTS